MIRPYFLATSLAAVLALLSLPAAATTVGMVRAQDLPNVPGMRMTAETVSYAPGEVSGAHRHATHGFLIAYVLEGHITSQVEGQGPEKTYGPGESWTEPPAAHHVVSKNASQTEPAKMLVVFVAPPDEVLTTPDPR